MQAWTPFPPPPGVLVAASLALPPGDSAVLLSILPPVACCGTSAGVSGATSGARGAGEPMRDSGALPEEAAPAALGDWLEVDGGRLGDVAGAVRVAGDARGPAGDAFGADDPPPDLPPPT